MALPQGETVARAAAQRLHAAVATTSALAGIPAEERVDGMFCQVQDGSQGSCSLWMFSSASTATDSTSQLVVTPSAGSGAWLRADKVVDLKIPVDFNATDAQVLFTVPTGFRLRPTRPFIEVTTPWTGGASSAIGLSSSNAAYNTKGDLLGGASGDVLAGLTNGMRGTIGAKVASLGLVVLVATDTVRFDRITSAFTAGVGIVHLPVELVS